MDAMMDAYMECTGITNKGYALSMYQKRRGQNRRAGSIVTCEMSVVESSEGSKLTSQTSCKLTSL